MGTIPGSLYWGGAASTAAKEHGVGVESKSGRNSSAQNPEEMAGDPAQLLTSHCLCDMQGRCLESPWAKLWSSLHVLGFRLNPLGLPSHQGALDLTFQVPAWMVGSLTKEVLVVSVHVGLWGPVAALQQRL